ncbi:MAG: PAS domain S-box protein [Candidatus Limnocylindria bacterium]
MPDTTDPSPLDVVPGLAAVGGLLADAVVVTDLHRRVVVWNEAAEALYGINARDALGTPIEQLYDSSVVGDATSSSGARTIALDLGQWSGRIADRPRIGRAAGQERIVETVLTRLDGPDGAPVGVLSVKRDVTSSVRVERELATLGELATSSGETRSRAAAAERALEVLAASLQTTASLVVIARGASGEIIASRDLPEIVADISNALPWSESPAIRAIATPGRVIKGAVTRLPLLPATRRRLAAAGIGSMLMVGLHRHQELVGVLGLAWRDPDPTLPSDATILLVASHLARSLENARLVEEVLRRAEIERETATRLRALEELTRIGGNVTTLAELAERSAHLIDAAVGGAGTAYGLLAAGGDAWDVAHLSGVAPGIADWLRASRPDVRSAFRRWRAGEGPFLEPFEAGVVPPDVLDLARAAGLTAYAAIPIRVDGEIVGGIASYFDRPFDHLNLDRAALDRISTVASISVENFRLRERLVTSESRYRMLFEKGPDAFIVTTTDGTIVDANEAATRMYGADREWLFGRSLRQLGDMDSAAAEGIARRSMGIRRDGSRFPQEVDIATIRLDDGERRLVRVRDLAEQDRLQAELVQAQKMEATGQLVSGVAHELNNPLAAILGFSQLIRRDSNLPADLRASADLLVEEATRTRRIVQDLLDFARQRPPERHPTSIRALIDSVLTLQSYRFSRGGLDVELDIPDDLPLVELDRGQLQQVLVNLTHNAAYAVQTGGGSRIRISAALEGPADARRVRLVIMDDGPGVRPEDVDRLFDAFFTTKPPGEGTGLGLPVSYGIVRSHGGELRYLPSAFETGAAFTFDLPVHAGPVGSDGTDGRPAAMVIPTEVDGASAPLSVPSGETIDQAVRARPVVLVIDDEASIRAYLGRALRTFGYDAVLAEHGQAALGAVTAPSIAAVLCDHQMPGMSGIDVYEAIVDRRPDLAASFVLMSGDVDRADVAAFTGQREVTTLAKPFDLDILHAVVEDALAARQSRG